MERRGLPIKGAVWLVAVGAAACNGREPMTVPCGYCAPDEACGADEACHRVCSSTAECGACQECITGLCSQLTDEECAARSCEAQFCREGCCELNSCRAIASEACGSGGQACVDCTAAPDADSCSADGRCVCAAVGDPCPQGEYCSATGCSSTCPPRCAGKCGGPNGCGATCPDNCESPAICGGAGIADVCGVSTTEAPCTLPWTGTVAHNASVTAYQWPSVACGGSCSSESRVCNNGTLSGSYTQQSCTVDECADCTRPWGGTITHGSGVTAYQSASVACGSSCSSETRSCADGVLSGTYQYAGCSIDSCCEYSGPFSGNDEAYPSGVTLSCPGNQVITTFNCHCGSGDVYDTCTVGASSCYCDCWDASSGPPDVAYAYLTISCATPGC